MVLVGGSAELVILAGQLFLELAEFCLQLGICVLGVLYSFEFPFLVLNFLLVVLVLECKLIFF
jgi:hypothetical protein